MKLYSISISYDEPSFSTLIIPGSSIDDAVNVVKEMTKNLKNVKLVQQVDTQEVEGMTEMIEQQTSANVVDIKSKKGLN